jgi:hypothetical protein
MEKIDLKQQWKDLYQASAREVTPVDVPEMNFLMIDGQGDPNTSQSYAEAVEALFGVAYALKFILKKDSRSVDYAVMPLEGLWWADDMSRFSVEDKSNWQWTMMILQPKVVNGELVEKAVRQVKQKKKLAALERLRFERFAEGLCAQVLHIGPFSAEGPTIARLHQFIDTRGKRVGKHHEIYLSDIRRADPAKWRTILRQPMEVG